MAPLALEGIGGRGPFIWARERDFLAAGVVKEVDDWLELEVEFVAGLVSDPTIGQVPFK